MEFSRLFRMYDDLGEKENEGNVKLAHALDKCDRLEYEVQKLQEELSEYHFYEYDL